jgi:hypothetical protein
MDAIKTLVFVPDVTIILIIVCRVMGLENVESAVSRML